MPTLTAAERRVLRANAHHLHPMVTIGTHGLTGAVLHEIDVALKAHELIKIRALSDVRGDRAAFLEQICAELGCAPVQHLGKILIVWRRNPDSKSEKADGKAARQSARAPRPQATAKGRGEEVSARSRNGPPSGAPRAPSRRRRTPGIEAADSRISDQSRRRRRAR